MDIVVWFPSTEVHKAFRFPESRERRTKKAGKPDMAVSDGCVSQSHSSLKNAYSEPIPVSSRITITALTHHHLNQSEHLTADSG